jgi:Bacterial antitoxin of type II TA system, VapB
MKKAIAQVQVDDKLIEEARTLGGHRTKKEAAIAALRDYIHYHRQNRILSRERRRKQL